MTSILQSTEVLKMGESLVSDSGEFYTILDEYFSVYKGVNPSDRNNLVWTNEGVQQGHWDDNYLIMRADGALIQYRRPVESVKPEEDIVWSSESGGHKRGDFFLKLQDDGQLAIIKGTPDAEGEIIWKSGRIILYANDYLRTDEFLVSILGTYFARLQADGNFTLFKGRIPFAPVEYDEDTGEEKNRPQLVWFTDTGGRSEGDFFALLEENGVLAIYSGKDPTATNNELIWSTERKGKDPVLMVTDAGNLEITASKDSPVWYSGKSFLCRPDELLRSGEHLASPAWKYFLVMGVNGNLLLYSGSSPDDLIDVKWDSDTQVDFERDADGEIIYKRDADGEIYGYNFIPCFLRLGAHGNLAIFEGTEYSGSKYKFLITPMGPEEEEKFGRTGGYFFLKLQDDGKLAIFRGTPLRPVEETWNTTIYFIIENYKIRVSNDWDRVWGSIECSGEKYTLFIYFLREGIIRKNYTDWENKIGVMYLPSELYPWILDLLRNERPIYGWWEWAYPERMGIMSTSEPVGEGEIEND